MTVRHSYRPTASLLAKLAGKPVLLDYYADWCTDCVRMEKSTFADAEVRTELMNRFVRLQVDVSDTGDPESKAIKARFDVYGPPATLFFSSTGEEIKGLRTYGFLDKPTLLGMLRRVN